MEYVEPKVFLLGATQVNEPGLAAFLDHLGVPEWDTDADGVEKLAEVEGRLCYKAFGTDLNPNLNRVREGNEQYLKNVIESGHGSVLEHGTAVFAYMDVSRVFTHELVRHRPGAAYSQESLRFVRLDNLKAMYPEVGFGVETMKDLQRAHGIPDLGEETWAEDKAKFLEATFKEVFEYLELVQKKISNRLILDRLVGGFAVKKKVTSAMRRLAPIGLATNIIATYNHRTLRHVIQMRTSRHAEEEVRLVFGMVAEVCLSRWPNLYQDMKWELVDGKMEYTFDREKV